MKRLIEVDILRTFATVLLLIHHSRVSQLKIYDFRLKSIFIIPSSYALLGIFCVLSGYLLGNQLKRMCSGSLWQYLARRISRLYPPYLLALFLFQRVLEVKLADFNLWAHIFGFQILLAPLAKPVYTLWYFSLLVGYLLIVPIGLYRTRKLISSSLYLLAVFTASAFIHQRYGFIDIRFFYYFWIFSIGSLIGLYGEKLGSFAKRDLLILPAGILLFWTGIHLQKAQITYITRIDWGHLAWVNAYMCSFIYLAFRAAAKIKDFKFISRISEFISKGSYFTYIFHRPIWRTLLFLFPTHNLSQLFLVQFVLGAPLVMLISGKLQPLYQEWIMKRRRPG